MNRNLNRVRLIMRDADGNLPPVRRIFNRVVQQVREQLTQPIPVPINEEIRITFERERMVLARALM